MRILLTTDTAGGVWSYTEELSDALLARGHEVALVSFGDEPGPVHREWLDLRPDLPFTHVSAPLEWMPEPEPALSCSVDALRTLVDRVRPDVIHLNQYFYGGHTLGVPALVVAHSDVASWWRNVKGENPPDDAWFRRYHDWVQDGLLGAHMCAAPSAWMAAQTEELYGAPDVRVVHNGRSHVRFASFTAREPMVVAAGRLWDEAKGVQDLAAAAPDIRGRVVLAGSATHPGGGANFATGSADYQGLLSASGLRDLLGRTAVYAATSRYEPFGLAPLEAALAGCALVMTDIPTFRELWDGCALFYPPGDTDALAECANRLLGDAGLCGDFARAAGERARQRYTPERMAIGYEALYQEMLA